MPHGSSTTSALFYEEFKQIFFAAVLFPFYLNYFKELPYLNTHTKLSAWVKQLSSPTTVQGLAHMYDLWANIF